MAVAGVKKRVQNINIRDVELGKLDRLANLGYITCGRIIPETETLEMENRKPLD